MTARNWLVYLATRIPPAFAVGALTALCVRSSMWIRHAEAVATAFLLRLTGFTATGRIGGSDVFVKTGPHSWIGLEVAVSCSIAVVLPSMLVVTSVLLTVRSVRVWRCLAAAAVAAAVFELCNLARLAGLCAILARWREGSMFEFAHTWLGTLVTLVGLTGMLAGYLYVLTGGRRVSLRDSLLAPEPPPRPAV